MPTILMIDGYRFFFYSADGVEPPHVHIEHGDGKAKFWLLPVVLASSYKMKAPELKKAQELTQKHNQKILEKWNEFFSTKSK
ncbi:MAG: DUF4160 domain-containing protein [Bacteriovoracaceae bacterium]|nr:DUF4160 domain-containing protein [Bacteriovoracaceae bacterium]